MSCKFVSIKEEKKMEAKNATLLWWLLVKQEARRRIANSVVVKGCQSGDRAFISALIVIFWKFVDEFPAILYKHFSESDKRLIQRMSSQLSGIAEDEKSHRIMWLKTAASLGITQDYLYLQKEGFPKVALISACLADTRASLASILLRIVGVEVVAESLSQELLNSGNFRTALEERALGWFKVHAVHEEGTTHEQIALRLALRELERNACANLEEVATGEVLHLVDLFIDAASNAPEIAREFALPRAA